MRASLYRFWVGGWKVGWCFQRLMRLGGVNEPILGSTLLTDFRSKGLKNPGWFASIAKLPSEEHHFLLFLEKQEKFDFRRTSPASKNNLRPTNEEIHPDCKGCNHSCKVCIQTRVFLHPICLHLGIKMHERHFFQKAVGSLNHEHIELLRLSTIHD